MAQGSLNRKQQAFVNEYLIDFNGTRAAKAVGYSERSAYSTAYEILRKPEVKAYLEQKVSESNELAFLERHRVLCELKAIGFAEQQDRLTAQYTAADRLKALHLIGKIYGLFWEKPEIKEESKWEKSLKRAIDAMNAAREAGKYPKFET